MRERQKIEAKLKRKIQEVQQLEDKLHTARVYVQALQDVLKVLDEPAGDDATDTPLKPGSAVAQAREFIIAQKRPVHIANILSALGKEMTRETRASLTSSLAAYVRRGDVFTRPAPNTFGLIKLGHITAEQEDAEPPSGFGSAAATESDDPPF